MKEDSLTCLFVSTAPLEFESPRILREISTLLSMSFKIHTLESLVVYLGSGHQGYTYSRGQRRIPPEVRRNHAFFLTLPVNIWLTQGSSARRLLFMITEPMLLAINMLILSAKLAGVVNRSRPDIIFTNGPSDLPGVVTRMVSSIFKVPYVFESRDPSPISYSYLVRSRSPSLAGICEWFFEILERYVVRGAKHVIVTNKLLGMRLTNKYSVLSWSVLYGSTIRHPRPKNQKLHVSPVLLLVVSGNLMASEHDLQTLLEAMIRLTNYGHPVKLRIVGHVGDDFKPLVTSSLWSSALVEILGWKNWDEYMRILSSESDVGIVPYLTSRLTVSAIPNKIFDYMAAGLPIVAPAFPGVMEIVNDGVNGLLYTPELPESLYEALLRLCDSKLRARLANKALQMFNSLFCEEVQMHKFKSIVKSIARN